MVNEEIFQGLKAGVNKGQTLKDSMMSFYNAGYPKEEIEKAARALQLEIHNQHLQQMQSQVSSPIKKPIQPISSQSKQEAETLVNSFKISQPKPIEKSIENKSSFFQKQKSEYHYIPTQAQSQKVTPLKYAPAYQFQKVSAYGPENTVKKSKKNLILLEVILFLLIGSLVVVFLLKDSIIEFFNNLF